MSQHVQTAIIIGGGIAGPVTAIALQRAGIEAAVYKAYPQSSNGLGGGMSIAPNGLDALDVIGVGDMVRPAGQDMTGIVMQDWKGRRLGEFGNPPGVPPMQFFYRSDLQSALETAARQRGIRIEYGKRLVKVTETPQGVTAHFTDGTQATAGILIGADGIRSTVRSLIAPDAPEPRYAGLISFGARVDEAGLPYDQAFAAYEAERRPRVERIIRETTHKNSAKTAGPVGRFINAWALRIFTRLAKPERMAWMFDYRIDWDAPASDAHPKRPVVPAH